MATKAIPNLIPVTTVDGTVHAINPDTVEKVDPSPVGSVLHFTNFTFLQVQEDFEELTGIDPEAVLEAAEEAKEKKAKEKAAEEAKEAKEREKANNPPASNPPTSKNPGKGEQNVRTSYS